MARKFRLSEQAEADLNSIWRYIASADVRAANGQIDRLTEAMDLLAEAPLAGRARPEFGAQLRSFFLRGYTIFYVVTPGGIEIARVLHERMDIDPADFS
ncbi:type II toxin-antitoxin system RelE/ParE family toxin [Rhodopseudomonas palustris]|uniref:Toxin n=1 Tax=Rhodopseudomonas palustris (strain BisB18) TaxID=316056 RepID=Q21D02_RHOPB